MDSFASTSSSKWRTQSQKLLKSFFKVDDNVSMVALNPVNAIYYPNWQVYHQPPSSLNLDIVSHVFYAFAW